MKKLLSVIFLSTMLFACNNESANNNEAEFIIQFSEKKTNSLQRIMDLLTEAYLLVS